MAKMTFRSCNGCYWCRLNYGWGKMNKCRLFPSKKFNHPKLHGWLCKYFCRFKEGFKYET